jgi:hypothetical protein
MARQLEGHTPEVNQFEIADTGRDPSEEFAELMREAVMHLALHRVATTKRADETDMRSFDYFLHPIFAPFFVYSYRKKRKLKLSQEQIMGLVGPAAREMIGAILKESGREESDMVLPEQLLLFGQYYGIDSE